MRSGFSYHVDVTCVNAAHDALLEERIDNFSLAQKIVYRVLDELDRNRITHGRHCTCGACEREDWTNPLFVCGMHGESCPHEHQPWGAAGDPVPVDAKAKETP